MLLAELADLHAQCGVDGFDRRLAGCHAIEEVVAVFRRDAASVRRARECAEEPGIAFFLHGLDLLAEIAVLFFELRVEAILAERIADARTLALEVGTQGVPPRDRFQPGGSIGRGVGGGQCFDNGAEFSLHELRREARGAMGVVLVRGHPRNST